MKFDIVHNAWQGRAPTEPPGLPAVLIPKSVAAGIVVAMLVAILAATVFDLVLAAPALADAMPPDLTKAAHDYDAAQMKGDGPELKRLLADDYTLVNGSGQVEDKAGLVADYTDPAYHIAPYVVVNPVVKVWGGDAAVLGGVVDLKGVDHGKPFAVTARFADIWAKRNGQWQVIYTEVTHVPSGGKS